VAEGYRERFIHGEILKKFPSVNAVVHSHAESVLSYGISGVPMKAVFLMGGFLGKYPLILLLVYSHSLLFVKKTCSQYMKIHTYFSITKGTHVPVWDIAKHYTRTDTHNLLVSNQPLGAALASSFTNTSSSFVRAGAAGISLVSSLVKSQESTSPDLQPDHPVVLMWGHGFTALGNSIKEAVYRAIYTSHNASIQTNSLLLRNAYLASEERGKTREEREKSNKDEGVLGLSEDEVVGCTEMGMMTVERPWGLWVREVEVEGRGLYVNKG